MEIQELSKNKENKYFWSKQYQLKYYEMDFKMTLKPSALLNFLQDMATINAEDLGFGYSFTYPKNYGWFLIKYHMEFDDYPQELDEIILTTEARGISKILASRDFEIWTLGTLGTTGTSGTSGILDKKKRLGRVISNWMMIDLNDKSIVPLSKTIDFMPAFVKRDTDLKFEKIKHLEQNLETINFEKTFEIRYDDIDVNQHVNNANYIIWAFEALPYEFKAEKKLKTLDIVYKKEIKFGNNIISIAQLDEETKTSTHVLKNAQTDEELCLVNAVWT